MPNNAAANQVELGCEAWTQSSSSSTQRREMGGVSNNDPQSDNMTMLSARVKIDIARERIKLCAREEQEVVVGRRQERVQ